MAEATRAYNFSKFDTTVSSAAVQVQHEIPAVLPEKKPEVVRLPKKQLEKNRRAKIKPLKAVAYAVVFSSVITVVSLSINSQVELTELTEQISQESYQLEKAQALEVELSIKEAEKMNAAKIEEYAREVLGMAKMNDSQVTYVNTVHEDKGEVIQQNEDSPLLKIWETIRGWFA